MTDDKMTLKLERGRLVLELPHNALDLEVGGKLQATYFLGVSAGPEDLRAELSKATAAKSACRMLAHVHNDLFGAERIGGPLPAAEARALWAAGFELGMSGAHRIVGGFHLCPIQDLPLRQHNRFERGWDLGYAIRAAVAMSQTGIDPRTQAQVPEESGR